MKTLYEVNWFYHDGTFERCTVTPIKVIREGVLPGCSGVTITAIDVDGRQFQGSPENYFETEAAAWADVREELEAALESNKAAVDVLNTTSARIEEFLNGCEHGIQ